MKTSGLFLSTPYFTLRLKLKLLCYGFLKSFCRKQNGSCSVLVRDILGVAETRASFGVSFSTGNLP